MSRRTGRLGRGGPLAIAALVALAVLEPAAAQSPSPAQAPAPPGPAGSGLLTTRVTYIGGASVYLEAGRDDGLQLNDRVEVFRDGRSIGALSVTYLSAHRAACAVVASTETIAVGDQARYAPHGTATPRADGPGAAAASAGAVPASAGQEPPRRSSGIHGRVGVRYMSVKDNTVADGGFTQPAIDLTMTDYGLGPIDFFVDVRGRRTYSARNGDVDETDTLHNVYRASVAWHLDDPRQTITFGRQFASSLAVVSLFDGALYDFNAGRWSVGGFAGTQPDPVNLEPSGDIREYGGYWQLRGAPEAARRWEITTGAIGAYQDGNPNREFMYVQGRYHGPNLSAYAVEEIDYYRGWKVQDAGESAFSLTSTFTYLTYQAGEHVTFYGGYDNRRNVRLYRDVVTPVTEFDDTHRQGGWGGASFRLGRHFDLGGDLRRSTGGPNGTADGYAVNLGVGQLTSANLSLTGRTTRYTNDESDGWIYALTTGFDITARVHTELGAGHLAETSARETALDRSADWYDLEISVLLARRWLLLLSTERYTGDLEDNDQYYASVSYRF